MPSIKGEPPLKGHAGAFFLPRILLSTFKLTLAPSLPLLGSDGGPRPSEIGFSRPRRNKNNLAENPYVLKYHGQSVSRVFGNRSLGNVFVTDSIREVYAALALRGRVIEKVTDTMPFHFHSFSFSLHSLPSSPTRGRGKAEGALVAKCLTRVYRFSFCRKERQP